MYARVMSIRVSWSEPKAWNEVLGKKRKTKNGRVNVRYNNYGKRVTDDDDDDVDRVPKPIVPKRTWPVSVDDVFALGCRFTTRFFRQNGFFFHFLPHPLRSPTRAHVFKRYHFPDPRNNLVRIFFFTSLTEKQNHV